MIDFDSLVPISTKQRVLVGYSIKDKSKVGKENHVDC